MRVRAWEGGCGLGGGGVGRRNGDQHGIVESCEPAAETVSCMLPCHGRLLLILCKARCHDTEVQRVQLSSRLLQGLGGL